MSMLSEQCEALRMWAKHLREDEPALASDLREAADTILNLRNMAQKAQSEKTALERRIDELCQENERLRKAKDTMRGDAFEMGAMLVKARDENAKLRELAVSYDSALHRICDQMQGYVDCHDCVLGKDYGDDSCAIDELREAACVVKVELE